jgi:hypothetical protein
MPYNNPHFPPRTTSFPRRSAISTIFLLLNGSSSSGSGSFPFKCQDFFLSAVWIFVNTEKIKGHTFHTKPTWILISRQIVTTPRGIFFHMKILKIVNLKHLNSIYRLVSVIKRHIKAF